MDPFLENDQNNGGKLTFNLGNISEDILKDGRKQYENGLPEDGDISLLPTTSWGSVVPQNQALVYAFSSLGEGRVNQDVGLDGYDDFEEAANFSAFSELADPANDNYQYFLSSSGNIFERYRYYNGLDGNSPETISDTDRGSNSFPDVEDINRDNTMNTIDSYFEYELDISPNSLSNFNNEYIDIIHHHYKWQKNLSVYVRYKPENTKRTITKNGWKTKMQIVPNLFSTTTMTCMSSVIMIISNFC